MHLVADRLAVHQGLHFNIIGELSEKDFLLQLEKPLYDSLQGNDVLLDSHLELGDQGLILWNVLLQVIYASRVVDDFT